MIKPFTLIHTHVHKHYKYIHVQNHTIDWKFGKLTKCLQRCKRVIICSTLSAPASLWITYIKSDKQLSTRPQSIPEQYFIIIDFLKWHKHMQQSGFKLIIMFQIYLVISNAPAWIQYCQLFANAGKCILVLLAKTVNRREKNTIIYFSISRPI